MPDLLEIKECHVGPQRKEDLDPTNDILFKFIFGKEERKQITIAFLNDLLKKHLGREIKDLSFDKTENNPNSKDDKLSRLDISCVLDGGEKVDVEMQVCDEHNIKRRTLYYWSTLFMSSCHSGTNYRDLCPAICINILDFVLFPDRKRACASFSIREDEDHELLNKDLNINFLEIPKFRKKKRMTRIEKWLALFSRKLSFQEKEEIAMNDPAMNEALKSYDLFFMNKDEIRMYVNRQMARMDYETAMSEREAKGIKKGKAIGMQEGEAIGMQKGEAIGMQKGEAIGIQKGEVIGARKNKENNFIALLKKGVNLDMLKDALGLSDDDLSGMAAKNPEIKKFLA